MPSYDVYVWTKFRRLKYPRGLNIPSLQAAHSIALRMARVFLGPQIVQRLSVSVPNVTSTLRLLMRMDELSLQSQGNG